MKKWNRMLAAVLSASMIFSMAPAGVWAAETAAVQESQEESGEFDAAMAAAQDSEEALAGGSDAASTEVAEEAESGAAEVVDAAEEAGTVDEAAGAEADTADAEDAVAADEAGVEAENADTDADEDADTADAADEKDAVGAEEADAAGEADTAIPEENDAYTAVETGTDKTETNESGEPDTAYETEITEQQSEEESVAKESKKGAVEYSVTELKEVSFDLGDRDALFEEYANRMFYGSKRSSGAKLKASGGGVGLRLEGTNGLAYQKLREMATSIADGKSDRAEAIVPIEELSQVVTINRDGYTAADLGVDTLAVNDEITDEAMDALYEMILKFDPDKVFSSLCVDCAYELYWNNGGLQYGLYHGIDQSAEPRVFVGDLVLFLPVDSLYRSEQGDDYSVDTTKTGAVKTASDRARQIVKEAAKMSDYYKLNYYREQICDLVEYDHDAADQSESYPIRGPWSLIFVFDDDPTTNVVCEGYAEAFQYLAELTNFVDDIQVYSVSGLMEGGEGAGKHKWNIVHMENGLNYIADITNSDAGTIGSDGSLFLAGMLGSVGSNYYKDCSGTRITYTYNADMRTIYEESELTLSPDDYQFGDPSTADDKAILKGLSLFLTDKIGMRVYVKTFAKLNDTDYMVFNYADKTVTVPVSKAKDVVILDSDGKSISVLAFEMELWTDQMTEDVRFHLNIDDQNGMEKTYSVRSYADQILAGNYSEKQKNMVRAMLNYGGYAQTYFKYNTDNMANDGIFEEGDTDPVQQENPDLTGYDYVFLEAEETEGFHIRQAALYLGTDVSLIYYYTLENGKSIEDFKFSLDESSRELEFGRDEQKGKDYVMIPHILPSELNQKFTLVVTPADKSNPITKFTYSAFSYCKAKIENANSSPAITNLCKSLYYYWKAANDMTSFNNMVTVSVDGQNYTLVLNDIAEARAFAEMLPMSLHMSFDDIAGYGTLDSAIANSAPETEGFEMKKGDLVLAGQNSLYLILANAIMTSSASCIKIGAIQGSVDFVSLVNAGDNIEVSFTAQ